MTAEVEIKFQCSFKVIPGLVQLSDLGPDYALSLPSSSGIHDTYFDTKDFLLLNHAASVRCRKKGSELKITFKSNARVKGASITRDKIERVVSGEPHSFVMMPAIRRIIPVLEVENRREVREIRRDSKELVAELSLD